MKTLRIGTRNSKLATKQANEAQQLLIKCGIDSELVFIETLGDLEQDKPLHELANVGIFTKALDDALLKNEIDIAVHSCKDLPSTLHHDLIIAAHLQREDPRDILICNTSPDIIFSENYIATIATGSIRRKHQWLSHFPQHNIVDLRGNIDTRLNKLYTNNWDAAIFSYAGLKRLAIDLKNYAFPEFLIPAAAQGVIAIVCKKDNLELLNILSKINHPTTALTTTIERGLLRLLDGGCVVPIGIMAQIENGEINMVTSTLNAKTKTMETNQFRFTQLQYDDASQLAYQQLQNL